MINKYTEKDVNNILNVINDAALKYKGVIPEDSWQEPYMTDQELIDEFANNVRIFGYTVEDKLVGVMGIQELEDVTLIRHAYVFSGHQGMGIGRSLLEYLFQINKSCRLLVGTWEGATWAVRFYLNNGFFLHKRLEIDQLLKKYWEVPKLQMENSVVLEKTMGVN